MINIYRPKNQLITSALVLLLAAITWGAVLAQGQGPAKTTEIQPGVLLESVKNRVFYMMPDGGIEAVDVATGASLWISNAAEKPVIASPGRLVAHSSSQTPGTLPLTFFDPDDGRVIQQKEAKLPDPVRVSVGDRVSSRFQIRSNAPRNSARLTWSYQQNVAQGMNAENPPPGIDLAGELSIDPQTGNVDTFASSAGAPASANIELPSADRSQSRRFRSISDDYVLVSSALEPVDGEISYLWQIEDGSGTVIGETKNRTSYSPFAVSGNMLVFINPVRKIRANRWAQHEVKTLHGIDLNSGEEIWTRDLRDTTYTGPLPH